MKLQRYLEETGQSRADFAQKIGFHHVTVAKWATDRMFPRPAALRAIEIETQGRVRANDFCATTSAVDAA